MSMFVKPVFYVWNVINKLLIDLSNAFICWSFV